MSSTLHDILVTKGDAVLTIQPDATLGELARRLSEHRVGAMVVVEEDEEGGQRVVGIVTERDLLYAMAKASCDAATCSLSNVKVREVMTASVITGTEEDGVEQVMGLMVTKRIRHLPILAEGKLVGIVSIGDVVKAEHEHLAMENRFMKGYIRGE